MYWLVGCVVVVVVVVVMDKISTYWIYLLNVTVAKLTCWMLFDIYDPLIDGNFLFRNFTTRTNYQSSIFWLSLLNFTLSFVFSIFFPYKWLPIFFRFFAIKPLILNCFFLFSFWFLFFLKKIYELLSFFTFFNE